MGRPKAEGPTGDQLARAAEGRRLGREAVGDIHAAVHRLRQAVAGDPVLTAAAYTVLLRDLVGEGRVDDAGHPVRPESTTVGVLRVDRAQAIQMLAGRGSALTATATAALLSMGRSRLSQILGSLSHAA